jgi:hypothetical protein
MRSPWRLLRELGVDGFVNFQMMIGGSIGCFLLNPVYWAMTIAWLGLHPPIIQQLFAPLWVYEMGALCLFLGNFLFVYLSAAACASRQQWDLVKYTLVMPLYWVLMSVGAYKAAAQLLFRPFYWEKTDHGFFRPQATG